MKNRSKLAALLAAAALSFAAFSVASAAGPGNNGLDKTGNGTTSNATAGGSLSDAGGSATMNQGAVMLCDGTSVGSVSASFTLSKTLDVGSVITVYLVPNNGSNADPAGNVSKNETSVTLTGSNNTIGSTVNWSISVTSAFTESSGGVLGVFAVNADNITAISSSKTNSLNCTEASQAPSGSPEGSGAGATDTPVPTDTAAPTDTAGPTGTPDGSGAGATDTPVPSGGGAGDTSAPTQPPTNGLASNGSGPSDGAWLLVVGLGVLLASIVVLTPARVKSRR
jgi:hypothetical protein